MPNEKHPMLDLASWDAANNGNAGLIIADGASVTVNVYGGMLVIKDGPMGDTRERRYARVPRTIKHILILSAHGYLSLDAMRWADDCQITWAIIDRSGKTPRTLATSGHFVNPVFERRQAMCGPGMPSAFTGVKIMRELITRKLEGQASNAERILRDTEAAKMIRAQIDAVATARSISTIMGYEGLAADAYWDAWRDQVVTWVRRTPKQPHWLRFPSRRTLRRTYESNRGATDPVNAMLNFGYKVAESECVLACYASALSPAMGIGHVDRVSRDSFALDLIEVMRPAVDRIIAGILAEKLDQRWYREDKEGMVQCCAPLTHQIAAQVHKANIEIVKALVTIIPLLDSPQSRRRGL